MKTLKYSCAAPIGHRKPAKNTAGSRQTIGDRETESCDSRTEAELCDKYLFIFCLEFIKLIYKIHIKY